MGRADSRKRRKHRHRQPYQRRSARPALSEAADDAMVMGGHPLQHLPSVLFWRRIVGRTHPHLDDYDQARLARRIGCTPFIVMVAVTTFVGVATFRSQLAARCSARADPC